MRRHIGPDAYKELFEPTTIGSLQVRNHYAMAPMGPLGLSTSDGGWNQRGIEYYAARARGGIGMIITGVCQVTNPVEHVPSGMMPNPTLSPGNFLRTSRELVEKVHAYDSKIVLQVGAGFGRVVMKSILGGERPAAPSEVPYCWDPSITCREITRDEIGQIVANFRVAAGVARAAGYDAIQVHAVHEGYLLDQFAIEKMNRRTDEYGGSLENRLRFAREIVEAVHETVGDDFPVQLRYSVKSMMKDWNHGAMPGEEFQEAGRDVDEGIEAARLLRSYGYDAFDIDVGCYDSWYWNHPPMYQEKGLYLPYAQQLKEAIPDLPIIVAGRLDDPDLALRATREIGADMVSLGRPVLADADIANKIGEGRLESIRPCISCQEGCLGRIEEYSMLGCAVNPEACREADLKLLAVPPHRRRKVMIIGGGVAGMEAARVLAERGHTPVLHEKADHLGGVVVAGGQPSFKDDDLDLVAWYEHELAELEVEVHLGSEVSAQTIAECEADELIVATGSTPRRLPIDFGPIPVVEATDALLDQDAVGQRVAIVGGGTTGCELALSLRERGREVTVVELEPGLLAKNGPLCAANRDMLRTLVGFRGTRVLTGSSVVSGSAEGLEVKTPTGTEKVAADTVITATGYTSYRQLWEALDGSPVPKHLLGDARRVSNIMYAIWDAYEVASKI